MAVQINYNIPCLANLCLEVVLNHPKILETITPDIQMAVGERMMTYIIAKKSDNLGLFKFLPLAMKQITSLSLSNHPHVTDTFLAQLPDLFPDLIYLDLENCSAVADASQFQKFSRLKKLILKGTQINEIAARSLSKSFVGLEVRLKSVSFMTMFSHH